MSGATKKTKRRKEVKKEICRELPPQVVTRALADNTYVGIVREGQLGEQYLECADAKYTWHNGIAYEGPFVGSRIEGKGRYLWPDGSSYEGELLNGKRHGQGVYVSADGLTRYEGQWCLGKRSGNGRLSYNPDGTSFYDGWWKDGKKHGQGRQVWPSGNFYEGDWADGKMTGQGTMVWRTGSGSERYTGEWRSNEPHGEGTHTWHSTDISATSGADFCILESPPARPTPFNPQQQQLNNRYEGQFVQGKRDGYGAFYYANGAYYRGEWKDHMKHGQGRHIFEDGTVYEGPFEEDRMVGYSKPPPAEGAELISRCTDLSDMDGLALPSDTSGFEHSAGAGYTDHGKIFREIYNMLLRHLGELRDLYARYRAASPRHGADPFALQSYQFWLFARDAGLITPACSLPRFNRAVFSGPRHHGEVSPEDLPDIRPIQRSELVAAMERRTSVNDRPAILGAPTSMATALAAGIVPGSSESLVEGESFASSEVSSLAGSSVPSPSNAAGPSEAGGGRSPGAYSPLSQAAAEAAEWQQPVPSASAESGMTLSPLGPRFQRTDAPLANIHTPTRQLLFRQFLEGIVRLSHARFPHERGLEAQIQRIFKECILPACEAASRSEHVFGFLSDRELQQVLEEFHRDLWGIFSHPGAGEGLEGERHQLGLAVESYGRVRRDLQVSARLDVTIRVKDVLQLLDRCGLLQRVPPARREAGTGVVEDPCGDDGEASADENASGGSVADKEMANFLDEARHGVNGRGGAHGSNSDFGGFMRATPGFDAIPERSSRKRDKAGNKEGGQAAAGEREPSSELSAADLAPCNFSITPHEVLKLLSETLGPQCLKGVCFEIGGLDPAEMLSPDSESEATDEQFPMLEYVETEIVFTEFVRLLLQIAELGMRRQPALAARSPPPRRFDAFLRHVFLPSLQSRYEVSKEQPAAAHGRRPPPGDEAASPRGPEGEDAEEGERLTSSREDAGGEAADAVEGADGGEAEAEGEAAAAGEAPAAEPLELWMGFAGPAEEPRKAGVAETLAVAAARGCRRWPVGYDDEVLAW